MHPLKIVQWCLFWKKVAKSWLQHVDGAWTSHCPLSVLLCFLCPLSRPSQSCATWLASIRMSVTLTGSFVRTPLDSKLGLFFFFGLASDLTLKLEERFSTSASHSWHSHPESLLLVSGFPFLSYPRKSSACPSLCPWDTVADMILHKRNSTRILHKRNSGKPYPGLWRWS